MKKKAIVNRAVFIALASASAMGVVGCSNKTILRKLLGGSRQKVLKDLEQRMPLRPMQRLFHVFQQDALTTLPMKPACISTPRKTPILRLKGSAPSHCLAQMTLG